MTNALAVFTSNGPEALLAFGGSEAWKIDRNRARECQYAVMFMNHDPTQGQPDTSIPKGNAFMVAEIAGTSESARYEGRKAIIFARYALIDGEKVSKWPGHRNPVLYTTLEEFGIDLDLLEFMEMPSPEAAPLTIEQAKAGLARTFNVRVDQIEITIRA